MQLSIGLIPLVASLVGILGAIVGVVWKLASAVSRLETITLRLDKIEKRDEAHEQHGADIRVITQRLDHKRERITALEARVARIEERTQTGRFPAQS